MIVVVVLISMRTESRRTREVLGHDEDDICTSDMIQQGRTLKNGVNRPVEPS